MHVFQFVNYEDESQAITRPSRLAPDIQIVSYTTLWLTPNPLDVTTSPLSPLQLKATMKSQEAVKKIFPNRPFGTPATCKEINQVSILKPVLFFTFVFLLLFFVFTEKYIS